MAGILKVTVTMTAPPGASKASPGTVLESTVFVVPSGKVKVTVTLASDPTFACDWNGLVKGSASM